jgi:Zn-dependent M28 family amino/carboxypeptidase
VGVYDGPRRCLKIVMAHTDSVPAGPGAVDNASGVGVVVALARRLPAIGPYCDVWLVATGAEERPYTGQADHLGARRLVKHVRRQRSAGRLRYAVSLDMVGRGGRFQVSSPHPAPRPRVEGQVLKAGRRSNVTLRFDPDSGTGNSDHREFELAGLPGLVIHLWHGLEPCYHNACDTWQRIQRRSLRRVRRVAEVVLRRR